MELRNCEESEELLHDRQNIKNFKKEINKTFDENLDKCLDKFMRRYNLKLGKDENVVYWLIKFSQFIKEELK